MTDQLQSPLERRRRCDSEDLTERFRSLVPKKCHMNQMFPNDDKDKELKNFKY